MIIAVLSNDSSWTYNLRKEILQGFIEKKHKVYVIVPNGKKIDLLKKMGCEIIESSLERHGTNPIKDLKLCFEYIKILKRIKADIVFTYTAKPNIYGGMACSLLKIPYVANITGLGTALEQEGPLQKISSILHKIGLKKAKMVFFQNAENRDFMLNKKIVTGRYYVLPGSGVNVEYFSPLDYPDNETVEFVFISRILKEKGIEQYLDAAQYITQKYPFTRFHICGFCEPEYKGRLQSFIDSGVVIYHGMVDDIRDIIKQIHCTIHPTYYPEGLSNVLLESSSSARPIITTDRSGCREVIDDGVNGYIVKQQDSNDLIEKIEKFLSLSWEERKNMGLAGRAKVEREFDRQLVVEKYLQEIENI